MHENDELVDALVAFGRLTGELSDRFIEIVTVEVARRGHLRCSQCGLTMREHVLRALRSGKRLDHTFAERGS